MKSCDYKCCVCVCVIEVETVKDIEKQYVEKQLKKITSLILTILYLYAIL